LKWLSDAVLAHLCKVADWPDLSGTRYELVDKIGQGGMGSVFWAHDRELDRPLALKVLNSLPGSANATAHLVKEARIVARLEHPSIVPVHDSGLLADGRFYYAMKLVRGQRLDDPALQPTALPERLQMFQKICDAVAFAHANGVLHRDLKPQNIMLGAFGEVVVLDWGLAKQVRDAPQRPAKAIGAGPTDTAHGTVQGTPGYMSPEQARGDVELIDERADVYGLGAILFFLLNGKPPANAVPGTSAAAAGAAGGKALRWYDRSIPRPLRAICLKALAIERADRYAGAAELAGDIADFLAGRRVRAYPEGILETVWRLGTKYRAAGALILAYVVMRILLLIWTGT
jgi:eukaryotic-like serine/threonine-protein kinase